MDVSSTGPSGPTEPTDRAGPQRVLFIGGLGRSGSTLIEKLLNELPGMVAVGELVHLWERGLGNRERRVPRGSTPVRVVRTA